MGAEKLCEKAVRGIICGACARFMGRIFVGEGIIVYFCLKLGGEVSANDCYDGGGGGMFRFARNENTLSAAKQILFVPRHNSLLP